MAKVTAVSGSRVHFAQEQVEAHDAEIFVDYNSHDTIDVHLGFLKFNHHYRVKFSIKDDLGEKVIADENENISIHSCIPNEHGHELSVEFTAYKERILEEMLVVSSAVNRDHNVTLTFHARVLGRGQGTPALRNGVQSIGSEDSPELNPSCLSPSATNS